MIPLRDEVTISADPSGSPVLETHAAYVGLSSDGLSSDGLDGFILKQNLVVIIEGPTAYVPLEHYVWHKGKRYGGSGAITTHYQHGEPHHVTIPLDRNT